MYLTYPYISNGIFPDKLKVARVAPVFKSGDSQYVSYQNHRFHEVRALRALIISMINAMINARSARINTRSARTSWKQWRVLIIIDLYQSFPVPQRWGGGGGGCP